MLPQEIQDKIFLYLDYNTLEKTRVLQSDYVKKITRYDNYIDAVNDSTDRKWINNNGVWEASKKGNLDNIKWLLSNKVAVNDNFSFDGEVALHDDIFHLMFENAKKNDNYEIIKWMLKNLNFYDMHYIYDIGRDKGFEYLKILCEGVSDLDFDDIKLHIDVDSDSDFSDESFDSLNSGGYFPSSDEYESSSDYGSNY